LTAFFQLQEIVDMLEAQIYDKVQSYYGKFIDAELEKIRSTNQVFECLKEKTTESSRGNNYQMFTAGYPSLTEHVT
jgi:V8-like Glu-specific endopeptidase